ncbi:medium-chain acyl-CoA ligase ACSF2, mitochondrial [Scaptodrosophila lebanonensis]|uniref:Medium-chain acyl-CoA ligase ACSF2, mitochondrial n=1 Tax=Drosophila lebanonensis TaxID=7225 RepID=A0A6J2TWG6_DROLE|nr:medium-chain acyl-CoA ligase ACSF2, mitochondrial [Scaptodrosophila lebanonensis]
MLNKKLQIVSSHLLRKRVTIKLLRCLSAVCSPRVSHLHHIGKEPLVYRNVGQQLELAAADYGSVEALVSCHEGKRYNYKSLLNEVDRLAAGFRKLGLRNGDALGVWGPNSVQWYLSMMGAARAGLVSVGINPVFQGPELEYCLKKVNIKALVAPEKFKRQDYYEIIKSICPEISDAKQGRITSGKFPHLQTVIIDSKSRFKGTLTFDEVMDLDKDTVEITELQRSICPDNACNVQFTSGTTGHPKAAVLSHYNFVNNGIHVANRNELEHARCCVQVPLFHAYGVVISIMAALARGSTLVLPSQGFSPKDSLQAIVNEKCTVIHGTPTMYVDLVRTQLELKAPLGEINKAITGGAPVSPQLILDMKQVLGVKAVHSVFGMTETTAVIFQTPPGDSEDNVLHTVGHLQDHVEAKVIDEQGHTVPFGQPGELCVRGYVTMLGYFGDVEKTNETIGPDKWLRTGDRFVLQENGYGRIVGRLKEMIIRGGENIFPKEIEDFLNAHPDILEAHVLGVPDERLGEEVCAFVRLRPNVDPKGITRDTLREYGKGKLAHFKIPRYIVQVEAFPKTTSGKIQKFKLLEAFQKEGEQGDLKTAII